MHSALLKTEALCWLRFGKKMEVCTEGSYWSADVLGVCDEYSIEVEVKTSRADLLAEFRNKRDKHTYYLNATNWSPTYLYYLIGPDVDAEKAIETVKEKFPKAGVLTYAWPRERPGLRLKCVKKPTKLHAKKPSAKFIESVRRRAGSELCGLHMALDAFKYSEIDSVQEVKQAVVDALIKVAGAEDWEKLDDGLGRDSGSGGYYREGDGGDQLHLPFAPPGAEVERVAGEEVGGEEEEEA